MSNNEWVREGTPREADWVAEEDEYGVPLEPAEWDDYSSEQAIPVPTPPNAPVDEDPDTLATAETAPEAPAAADEHLPEPGSESPEEPGFEEPEFDEPVSDEPEFGEPVVEEHVSEEHGIDDAPTGDAATTDATDVHLAEADVAEAFEVAPLDPSADEVRIEEIEDAVPLLAPHDAESTPEPQADADAESQADADVEAPGADVELAAGTDPDEDLALDEPDVSGPDAGEGLADDEEEFHVSDPVIYPPDAGEVDVDATAIRTDLSSAAFGRPVDSPAEPEVEATQAMLAAAPLAGAADGAVGTGAPAAIGAAAMAGLYRDRDSQDTQVLDTRPTIDDERAEEERIAQQLRMEKEARDQRLGLVATSEANAVRDTAAPKPPGVGAFGSIGLFILRIVTASILGVVAYQILGNIDRTEAFLAQTLIPEPRLVSWILGFALGAMAVFLVIGLAVRVVGLLLAIVAGGALAFVRWGPFSPFVEGMEGFLGDKDLLLAAVGLLFFTLGGGRAGIDGAISMARFNARESRNL